METCENCGEPCSIFNSGIPVFGQAAISLGLSEDTCGGYTLCDTCAAIAESEYPIVDTES